MSLGVGLPWMGGMPLSAREKAAAESPPIRVEAVPAERGGTPPATPGAQYRQPAAGSANTSATYRLEPNAVRLDFRDGVLHVTVLSGLIRLELHDGHELVILSTGDDIEISGLAAEPAAAPAAAEPPVLVELYHLQGDPAEAANHILRLVPERAINLRNNGGYPIAVNARGKLLRLDEGGSGIALDARGRQVTAPNPRGHPRRRSNPAAGGATTGALFKP